MSASTFAFFHLYFYWPLIFKKTQKTSSYTNNEGVSIIIAAHNEALNLVNHLPLILSQDHPNFEVIVINDRSTDKTATILDGFSKSNSHLKTIYIEKINSEINGKKNALNEGIKLAQNDTLLFTDADCYPLSKQWISTMQNTLGHKSICLGYSPYKEENTFLNKFIQFETTQTALQYFSFALKGIPYMGVGRNLMYRKSIFLQHNGFENIKKILGGDDDLLIGKIANCENTTFCLEEKSFIESIPEKKWHNYHRQKSRHYSVGQYYKPKTKALLAFESLSHFLFYLSLCSLPIFTNISITATAYSIVAFGIVFVTFLKSNLIFNRRSTNPFQTIIFDVLHTLYRTFWGLKAIFYKPRLWK